MQQYALVHDSLGNLHSKQDFVHYNNPRESFLFVIYNLLVEEMPEEMPKLIENKLLTTKMQITNIQ